MVDAHGPQSVLPENGHIQALLGQAGLHNWWWLAPAARVHTYRGPLASHRRTARVTTTVADGWFLWWRRAIHINAELPWDHRPALADGGGGGGGAGPGEERRSVARVGRVTARA